MKSYSNNRSREDLTIRAAEEKPCRQSDLVRLCLVCVDVNLRTDPHSAELSKMST